MLVMVCQQSIAYLIFNKNVFFIFNSQLYNCSTHFALCNFSSSCSPLRCSLYSTLLLSQPSADNYMEKDKWQHPQKSKAAKVPGSAGNSQHSARGLRNLRMQSWESQRRKFFQRTSAGLQWVWACSHSHSILICSHFHFLLNTAVHTSI